MSLRTRIIVVVGILAGAAGLYPLTAAVQSRAKYRVVEMTGAISFSEMRQSDHWVGITPHSGQGYAAKCSIWTTYGGCLFELKQSAVDGDVMNTIILQPDGLPFASPVAVHVADGRNVLMDCKDRLKELRISSEQLDRIPAVCG